MMIEYYRRGDLRDVIDAAGRDKQVHACHLEQSHN